MLPTTWSTPSAYAIVTPWWSIRYSAMRSKMWQRGRNERATSCRSSPAKAAVEAFTLKTMLEWVSITPLGSPVVPEV